MATNGEDWAIQLSVKHGPLDDRGNPMYMTNVRGYTATEIREHMEHLAENGKAITDACNEYAALQTLQREFRTEEVRPSRYGGGKKALRERDGELCEPHGLPMRYKSGKSKAGNNYELLECTAKQNPCDTIWPEKD